MHISNQPALDHPFLKNHTVQVRSSLSISLCSTIALSVSLSAAAAALKHGPPAGPFADAACIPPGRSVRRRVQGCIAAERPDDDHPDVASERQVPRGHDTDQADQGGGRAEGQLRQEVWQEEAQECPQPHVG